MGVHVSVCGVWCVYQTAVRKRFSLLLFRILFIFLFTSTSNDDVVLRGRVRVRVCGAHRLEQNEMSFGVCAPRARVLSSTLYDAAPHPPAIVHRTPLSTRTARGGKCEHQPAAAAAAHKK